MKQVFTVFILLCATQTFAANPTIQWPNQKIVCGGTVDGEDLNVRVVLPNELLAAESKNGRVLIYLDFHKVGQIHVAMNDGISDDEAEVRDQALAKLDAKEAVLMRALSGPRQSEFFVGLSAEGFAHFQTQSRERSYSLSCQEVPGSSALK